MEKTSCQHHHPAQATQSFFPPLKFCFLSKDNPAYKTLRCSDHSCFVALSYNESSWFTLLTKLCSLGGYNRVTLCSSPFSRPQLLGTIFKYMINKFLELNHIFQFGDIQFPLTPSTSSPPSFSRETLRAKCDGREYMVICSHEVCNQPISDKNHQKYEVGHNVT